MTELARKRCDCEIRLDAAIKGHLPGVCVWCGEATNRYCPVALSRRLKRVFLRLPLCSADKNHWRRRNLAFYGVMAGLAAVALGILLCVLFVTAEFDPRTFPVAIFDLLFLIASSVYLLGIAIVVVCLTAYVLLTIRTVQIRRLGRETVTLKRVAPEFAEAYRIHRSGRLASHQ
jgi:hypothetical protein